MPRLPRRIHALAPFAIKWQSNAYQMPIKCHRLAVHFRLCQNQFHEICGLAILPLNGDVFLASATQWQTEADCGYSLATMSAMR